MDIYFANRKLERQMTSPESLKKAFGDRDKRIKLRLSELGKASCLADIPTEPPARRHLLKGKKYGGCFAVDVSGNWRLIFKPLNDDKENEDYNEQDLQLVTAIRIIGVKDYHKKK